MTPTDYVFLHGGAQGGWVWDETLAALDRQTGGGFGRALVLDVPGCGTKRGRATDGLGPDEVAAELFAEIAAAGLRDVLLVGHSQAGTVLPRLIGLEPQRFRRAVYVSAIAPLPGQTVLDFRASLPDSDAVATPKEAPSDPRALFRSLFCNDMGAAGTEAFLDKLGADAWPAPMYAASDWPYDHLAATPASYVLCLRDAVLPVAWQEIFADRFKAERRIRLDCGHQAMNTRPHALAEVLRQEAAA
ncbi:alpha/beta fold hydrolase [Phenylobacterium sp. LjRoot219]|uniref:alpha/beta fold hydrolase n=1 Tax=Phenylobacterium sp. LjRoot219 TaxID=3342283 RepID=UPI003ECD4125